MRPESQTSEPQEQSLLSTTQGSSSPISVAKTEGNVTRSCPQSSLSSGRIPVIMRCSNRSKLTSVRPVPVPVYPLASTVSDLPRPHTHKHDAEGGKSNSSTLLHQPECSGDVRSNIKSPDKSEVKTVSTLPKTTNQKRKHASLEESTILTQLPSGHGLIGCLRLWKNIAYFIHSGNGLGVLHGKVGSGKSFGLRLLAAHMKSCVVELNSCTCVTEMKKILRNAASSDLPSYKTFIVCEDINGWQSEQIATIIEFASSKSAVAVICTSDNIWDQCIKSLRKKWVTFHLKEPSVQDARQVLLHAKQDCGLADEEIYKLLKYCRFDLRQLLINSSFSSKCHRCDEGALNMFEATDIVLKGPSVRAQW
eukprot:6214555-Pleurochrysis_carterae.AAC.1